MVDFTKGKISNIDKEYLLKYGIQPEKWAERMVKSFKDAQGFTTKYGGYQSRFWQWQDMEASNEFGDAVFKGIQNTIIQRGMADSPFWADNLAGMIFHTFTGWAYASVNRYLIPSLQRPDIEQGLGVLVSLGFGALVSPMRRIARGEDAYPEDMTAGKIFYEAVSDSAVSSALANSLSWANWLSGDKILGDLKNDKYRQRVGIGSASAVWNAPNKMWNLISAAGSGELNQKDLMQAAKLLPLAGASYGYDLTKHLIEKTGLPATRGEAHASKG